MTDMYDEPKKFMGKLQPYGHEEMLERGRAKDPVAYLQSVEQRARERQVAYETVKLLRQRVINCYRKEGVNHYEKCRKEATEYYNTVIDKDMGQLQPDWSKPEMKDGW